MRLVLILALGLTAAAVGGRAAPAHERFGASIGYGHTYGHWEPYWKRDYRRYRYRYAAPWYYPPPPVYYRRPRTVIVEPPPRVYVAPPAVVQAQPYCREYQQTLTIAGQPVPGFGTACQQPDGSWQLGPWQPAQ